MAVSTLLLGVPGFTFVKKIGEGFFGIVSEYKWRPSQLATEELCCAVKFINSGQVPDFKFLRQEALNHRALQHRHVIELYKVGLTPNKENLYLVMECADGGDLEQYIQRRGGKPLTEDEARYVLTQVLCALDFCHKKGVVNRDIKLENMLLSSTGAQTTGTVLDYVVKICDFGYSKRTDTRSMVKTYAGTQTYMAPEVLSASVMDTPAVYSGEASELWSIGVCLYVMLFWKTPFEVENPANPQDHMEQYFINVLTARWQVPEGMSISEPCFHLLTRLLDPDPSTRATMEEVLSHPWFGQQAAQYVQEVNAAHLAVPPGSSRWLQEQPDEAVTALLWEAECRAPSSGPIASMSSNDEGDFLAMQGD